MRRLLSVLASSAVFSFGLLAVTAGEARADEPAPAGAAPATGAAAPAEKPAADDDDDKDLKRIALELNPVGIAIGRYSIQGEYMLARHHAVTLNPFFQSFSPKATINGQEVELGSTTGFGGELGYRFYTGNKGANGFFVGPSFLFASYSSTAAGASTSNSFTAVGGAVDIGGQFIIGPGVVLGVGGGLQYTSSSADETPDGVDLNLAAVAVEGGVRPRLLFAVGYSF